MPVSPDHQLIFVHVPKNAGTTIEAAFDMAETGHHPWTYYARRFEQAWGRYHSFAVVRNPFDRLVSNYAYARLETSYWHSAADPDAATYGKHPDYDFLRERSFKECLMALPRLVRTGHPGWRPQFPWVTDGKQPKVDRLLRFEHLEADLRAMCRDLGLPTPELPHLNAARRAHDYRDHFDDELIYLVNRVFARDLDLFGYRFDAPRIATGLTLVPRTGLRHIDDARTDAALPTSADAEAAFGADDLPTGAIPLDVSRVAAATADERRAAVRDLQDALAQEPGDPVLLLNQLFLLDLDDRIDDLRAQLRRHWPPRSAAQPTISVVIPCFNQGVYLREAVESVVAQTRRDWELIIVDDGSTDDSGAIADVLAWRFSEQTVRVIHQANAGLAAARNAGIREARGRYLLPLDADDILHPEMLARTAAILETDAATAIAYTDREDFGERAGVVPAQDWDFETLRFGNQLSYCALYRRTAWADVGGYDESMDSYEDWDFWLRCGRAGLRGRRIPEPLFRYRVRAGSMYCRALERDEELKARLVENHPDLYDDATRKAAATVLARTTPEDAGRGPAAEKGAEVPTFSVVIPTYNRPLSLHAAIASVLAQTDPDLEVIVVNDAGVDVRELIDALADARIRYIEHAENRGLAAARTTGLHAARGRFAALLDDDDLFYPEHLATARRHLNDATPVVYTDAVRATYERRGDTYQLVEKRIPYSLDFDRGLLLVGNIAPVNCFVFRLDLAHRAGLFDPTFEVLEDWDFWLRLSALAPFRHIAEATVQVNWRADGSTMTGQRRTAFAGMRARLEARHRDELSLLPNREAHVRRLRTIWAQDNTPAEPLVSIVVLTHNALDYTKRCLASVLTRSTIPYELIVVDNGSTDGTVAYLEHLDRSYDHVRVIRNDENRGYGPANNQGMAAARGWHVVLLNNDTVVPAGWLERLVAAAEVDPRIGLVGPVTNRVSGPQRIADVPYDPTTLDGFDAHAAAWAQAHASQTTDFWRLVGFCLLLRREVIERIGGFDPRFGVGNYEDEDLCLRAAIAGFRAVIATDVFIHHFGSRTFAANAIDADETLRTNWERFKSKWDLPERLPAWYRLNYDLQPLMNQPFDPKKHMNPIDDFNPGTPSTTLLELIKAYQSCTEQQEWSDAEAIARQSTDLYPEHSYPWVLLATSLRLQDQTEEALDALLNALQQEETPEALFELAQLSVATDNQEEATEAVELLKTRFPHWTEAMLASNRQNPTRTAS